MPRPKSLSVNPAVFLCVFFALLMATGVLHPQRTYAAPAGAFRAVWVPTVGNLDFPSEKGLDNDALKKEINTIISAAVDMRLNAIFVQVRPSGDAFYHSSLFPWSEYLTGTQGVAPKDGFDPLAYWVARAHFYGIELHAWINPYRITTTGVKITDVAQLSADNPARKTPSRAVAYNGALYYDPGLPENKQLVVDGIAEILRGYDVDGIHLDDYFYPGVDFPDGETYAKYGAGADKNNWRRENVNDVIKSIQKTVAEMKPGVRFGVSPFAIWQNLASSELGSDTRGNESHNAMFADTRRWVKEGWLDYICPQIYWHQGFAVADYTTILNWWADVCKDTGVDLYIGHAAYKESDGYDGWPSGELISQLKLNASSYADIVKGTVFFRYGSLKGDVGRQIASYYGGNSPASAAAPVSVMAPPISAAPMAAPAVPIPTTLSVAQPAADVTVTSGGYYLFGTSDPSKPLYMNGQAVDGRTAEGFFGVYVKLEKGANTFRFAQETQDAVARTITLKDAVAATVPTMPEAAVTNAFPSGEEYVSAGDTIVLKCTAPIGADVRVSFNGETLALADDNPNRQTPGGNAVYATTYSRIYTVPESQHAASIAELGNPVYSMSYNGKAFSATGAGIKLIRRDAAFYATVTADSAWAYPAASSTGGSDLLLLKGQKDVITAISRGGGWVRLASGLWVEKQDVECKLEDQKIDAIQPDGAYAKGETADVIRWKAAHFPVTNLSFDGTVLRVGFSPQAVAPRLALTEAELAGQTVFQTMSAGTQNGAPYLTFTVKDSVRVEGYYVSYTDGVFSLHIKKPRALAAGDKPLAGFKFVIDAGHGDSDTGAIGPMGKGFAEKNINLINARKLADRLSRLGATVVSTRVDDTFFTLHERVEVSRRANPDLFLSVHANSVAESTDATNIRGISYWFRNPASRPLADHLIAQTYDVNPGTTRLRLSNQSNFYVCRPAWCPSVIVEASFMCNAGDFSWMISPARQDELADAVVNAILSYYR